jgi:hypothetical protein
LLSQKTKRKRINTIKRESAKPLVHWGLRPLHT